MADDGNPYEDFLAGRISSYERDRRARTWRPPAGYRSPYVAERRRWYADMGLPDLEPDAEAARGGLLKSWDEKGGLEKIASAKITPANAAGRFDTGPGYHGRDKQAEARMSERLYPNSPKPAGT